VVVAVLLVVVGPACPTTTNSTAITKLRGKLEAATAVVELLMMGMRTPESRRARLWPTVDLDKTMIDLENPYG
jgi:hypothetical protein